MKANQRNALQGCYFPGFFQITVFNAKNLSSLTIQNDNVLFHEYVHLMQDFTTLSGYLELYYVASLLIPTIQEINSNNINPIPSPYNPQHPLIVESQQIHHEQVCFDTNKFLNYRIVNVTRSTGVQNLSCIKLTINDGSKNVDVQFGIYQIEEIMAECCESQHQNYTPTNMYPYDLWNKFNQHYNLNLSKDEYAQVAYLALDSKCPGSTFIDILSNLTKPGITASAYLNSYVPCSQSERAHYRVLALQAMDAFFSTSFPSLVSWYISVINTIQRYDNPVHRKALLNGMLTSSSEFDNFVSNVGMPIVSDGNPNRRQVDFALGFTTQCTNPSDFYALVILKDIFDSIFYQKQSCILDNICYSSYPTFTSINCVCAPWQNSTQKKCCYYYRLWNDLGLSGKTM